MLALSAAAARRLRLPARRMSIGCWRMCAAAAAMKREINSVATKFFKFLGKVSDVGKLAAAHTLGTLLAAKL